MRMSRLRESIAALVKRGVGHKIHHFRMSVDQHMQLTNDGIIYAGIVTGIPDLDPDRLLKQTTTLAGKPVIEDPAMDLDCINIEDDQNHILLKIEDFSK